MSTLGTQASRLISKDEEMALTSDVTSDVLVLGHYGERIAHKDAMNKEVVYTSDAQMRNKCSEINVKRNPVPLHESSIKNEHYVSLTCDDIARATLMSTMGCRMTISQPCTSQPTASQPGMVSSLKSLNERLLFLPINDY